MASSKGIILAANVSAGPTVPVAWPGGKAALVTNATAYGTTVQLQVQGPNAAWIALGTTIAADAVTAFDLPAGQYRMNISGGTTTALYANLVGIPLT